MKLRVTPLSGL